MLWHIIFPAPLSKMTSSLSDVHDVTVLSGRLVPPAIFNSLFCIKNLGINRSPPTGVDGLSQAPRPSVPPSPPLHLSPDDIYSSNGQENQA